MRERLGVIGLEKERERFKVTLGETGRGRLGFRSLDSGRGIRDSFL